MDYISKRGDQCSQKVFNSFKEKLDSKDISGAFINAVALNSFNDHLYKIEAYKKVKEKLKSNYIDTILDEKTLDSLFSQGNGPIKDSISRQKKILKKHNIKNIDAYLKKVNNIVPLACSQDIFQLAELFSLELTKRRAQKIIQVISSIKGKKINHLTDIDWSHYSDELLKETWDGWFNEYELKVSKDTPQSLVSAGKYGLFGTKDDLTFKF